MTNIQIPLEYLQKKVSRSNAHIACNILKNYEHFNRDIESFIVYAIDTIQQHFTRNSLRGNKSYQGEANLTHVSASIGEYILTYIKYDNSNTNPWDWFKLRVMMGDLFIECFYNLYQIDIGKNKENKFVSLHELDRNLKRSRTHYVIVPDKWNMNIPEGSKTLLEGTVLSPPENVTQLIQPTNTPVIKHWNEDREVEFKNYLRRDFVKAIDVIQQTGWKINKDVHEAIDIYRKEIIHNYHKFYDVGDGQSFSRPPPKSGSKDHKDYLRYKSHIYEYNIIQEKSKLLLDKTFFQYVDLDYRGRVYYLTSFLNFQSNDLARGQMEFAIPKRMTEEGLRWLKIHTASSYNETFNKDSLPWWLHTDYKPYLKEEELEDISVDKMTLQDREQWTDENLEKILELANNKQLDFNAEKPITFYACCLELRNLVEAINKGEDYWSRLPISIDGSNNGWQHLSAISKDKDAGKLVGVVPQEIQKDFYVQCAKELIKLKPDWFEKRNMPMKHIRKGIAKRGSMTRAYSAGADKIAENMYLDCHILKYTTKYNITEKDCLELSHALIEAIDKVCAGPLQTMKFLQKIAESEMMSEEAREAERKSMRWTTPTGFPVIYEKFHENEFKERAIINCDLREEKPIVFKTSCNINGIDYDNVKKASASLNIPIKEINNRLKSEDYPTWIDKQESEEINYFQVKHVGKENTDIPKIRSFMSGISPNFIHSMDASHMASVICKWNKDFGAVHDSFSVHASEVDELLEITKDEFIKMYDYPNFFDEIKDMILTDHTLFNYNQPSLGDLEIREVNNSDYFFA